MTTRVAYFPALLSASVPDSTLALAPAGVPPESLQSFASCDRDVPMGVVIVWGFVLVFY